MARRATQIEIETTIISNDHDAILAWVAATELLFRLKARREARLADNHAEPYAKIALPASK